MGSGMPEQQGLYSPSNERDACGLGFVAHIKGKKATKSCNKVCKFSRT